MLVVGFSGNIGATANLVIYAHSLQCTSKRAHLRFILLGPLHILDDGQVSRPRLQADVAPLLISLHPLHQLT